MTKVYNPISKMNFGSFFKLLAFAGLILLARQEKVHAQQRDRAELQQIQDAKVSMITNRLKLTTEQSEKFWPVYNEFSEKRRELRRAQRRIIMEKREGGMTDRAALSNLKEIQELKQKEVNLEKEYHEKFLTIISPSQLAELQSAEKAFNDMLLQRLDRRRRN